MQEQIRTHGKITSIGNQFAQEVEHQQQIDARRRYLRHVHRRRLWVLLVILLVVLIGLGLQIFRTNQINSGIKQQVQTEKKQLSKTKAKNDNFKIQVKQLNNKTYIEKLIRYKYDYSKKGELIFTLPETNSSINAKN
ncbi:FtsB family cell division protein [Lapidilactobacillus bayanensis]|uniref:FtsB family cell division protein n=1 Tax=Lapidilactobacillus bayanensis TaxID=2485998 RepID=UPI000F79395D|nr:septum formation initiator family protein [Lapidilactobacillus bayanensis]